MNGLDATYETTTDLSQISPVTWVIWIAIIVLEIVALWKIYTKAGQPGWASIIPIYNIIVLLRIIKMEWWHILIMLFVPFASIVYSIIFDLKLAKVFGKGTGFGILMIFFTPIMYPILAFGDAKYEG